MDPADLTTTYDVFAITSGYRIEIHQRLGEQRNSTDLLGFRPAAGAAYFATFEEAGIRGRFWTSTFNDECYNPGADLSSEFNHFSAPPLFGEWILGARIKDIIRRTLWTMRSTTPMPMDDGSWQLVLTNAACAIECDDLADDSDLSGASWGKSGSGASVHVNPGISLHKRRL